MAQFRRSLLACSFARHAGHLPSADRQRRMQIEQKVCEHEVIMGVLKKSLQT